jgi:hypothetical protein
VTDAGLEQLAGFRKLASLFVKKTNVTKAGVKKLAAALPRCKIEWDGGVIGPKADVSTTAPREDAASTPFDARDPFQPTSVWVCEETVLTVTERKGETFQATQELRGAIRVIKGTVKDGKAEWFRKDAIAIRGDIRPLSQGAVTHGTITSDNLGDKIDVVWVGGDKTGQYTLRLQNGAKPMGPFQPKSIWFSDKPRRVLTVTERKGAIFQATFEVGPSITRMIKGTVKDGKVDWFAKDVRAIRGNVGDDNQGTITNDDLGDKIDFVWGLHGKQKGQYTLRLRN